MRADSCVSLLFAAPGASVSDWPLGPLDLVLGGSLAVSAAYRADAVLCLPGSLSLSRATGKVVVSDKCDS